MMIQRALAAVAVLFALGMQPATVYGAPLAAPGAPALAPRPPVITPATPTPAPANSAVTINVPVHVTQVPPPFVGVDVHCAFKYAKGYNGGGGTEVGDNAADFTNQSYNGTLPVFLKLNYLTPAAAVTGWQCDLMLMSQIAVGGNQSWPAGPNVPLPQGKPKPGAPFVGHVEGSF
jgi:hypothetical protein